MKVSSPRRSQRLFTPILLALLAITGSFFMTACFDPEIDYRCDFSEIPIAFDQPGPEGEKSLDYLALAEMDVDLTLQNEETEGEEPLAVTIVRIGEDAYSVETEDCQSRFQIPLRITLKTTESSLLDEVFALRGYVVDDDLHVSHRFAPGDLQGDFSPTFNDGEINGFVLSMEFRADGSGIGEVSAEVERQDGGGTSWTLEPGLYWEW